MSGVKFCTPFWNLADSVVMHEQSFETQIKRDPFLSSFLRCLTASHYYGTWLHHKFKIFATDFMPAAGNFFDAYFEYFTYK